MVDIDTAVERDMRRKGADSRPRVRHPEQGSGVEAETEPRREPLPRDGECAVCGRECVADAKNVELCDNHSIEDLEAKREAMSERERRAEERHARHADMMGER